VGQLQLPLRGFVGALSFTNPDDVTTILLDPSKTEEDFDWTVQTSLEKGVERAIRYYQDRGIDQTYTHLRPVQVET